MITNLLASIVVSLVTNICTTDNAQYEWNEIPQSMPAPNPYVGIIPNPNAGIYYSDGLYRPPQQVRGKIVIPATERTDTITIKEISNLEFDWQGTKRTIPSGERVVSSKTITYRKSEEWKEIAQMEAKKSNVTLELSNGWPTNRMATFLGRSDLTFVAGITNINIK